MSPNSLVALLAQGRLPGLGWTLICGWSRPHLGDRQADTAQGLQFPPGGSWRLAGQLRLPTQWTQTRAEGSEPAAVQFLKPPLLRLSLTSHRLIG